MKAISLKVVKLGAVETKFSGTPQIPMPTPTSAIATDSKTKAIRILRRRKLRDERANLLVVWHYCIHRIHSCEASMTAIMRAMKTARPLSALAHALLIHKKCALVRL